MSSISDEDLRTGHARHRCAALVHHYFELLEDPARPIEPFAELFADEFHLDFTMTQISTLDEFAGWAQTFRAPFEAFTLTVIGLHVAREGDGMFSASMDLEFDAIGLDGERKELSTRHTWSIDDQDRSPPFAKIKTIRVEHA